MSTYERIPRKRTRMNQQEVLADFFCRLDKLHSTPIDPGYLVDFIHAFINKLSSPLPLAVYHDAHKSNFDTLNTISEKMLGVASKIAANHDYAQLNGGEQSTSRLVNLLSWQVALFDTFGDGENHDCDLEINLNISGVPIPRLIGEDKKLVENADFMVEEAMHAVESILPNMPSRLIMDRYCKALDEMQSQINQISSDAGANKSYDINVEISLFDN